MIATLVPMLLPILGKVIDRVIPDPVKAAEAHAELEKALMDNQEALWGAMSKVMAADSGSESAYVRYARPTVVYWSLGLVTYITVTAPFGHAAAMVGALAEVPAELWLLMTAGVGIFGLTRGTQKTAAAYRGN